MAGIATMKDNVRLFIWDEDKEVTAADKMGNITQIGDVGAEAEDIDVTTIDSLAREYENGFDDSGSVDITQNITTTESSYRASRQTNGDDVNWGISAFNKKGEQIIGLRGKGMIKSAKLTGISVGGLLQCNSSLRINGAIDNTFVDPIGPTTGIPVSKVTVTGMGGASTITTKGGTLQCVAAIEPADATNKAVTWSVDNDQYASISSTGLLTAKADGEVNVTATAKDGSKISGSLQVTITGQSED